MAFIGIYLIQLWFSIISSHLSSTHSDPQFPINVWPKPRSFSWSSPYQATLVSPKFTITSPNHPHLAAAVRRYRSLILTERHRPIVTPAVNLTGNRLETLAITVADLAAPLRHGVNDSYSLVVADLAADLTAETAWGAMRGLETFSQLVWGDPPRAAAGVRVRDWAMFGHRGVMLDTARNFYPVEDILRTIKGMSMNKMSVFHWHITDSQSFPLVLPSEPDLAGKGAYGGKMRYFPADVRRIVEFGLEHGVRVLPEFDSPAHTGSWTEAYPEIVACANMFWWPAGSDWADRLASEPGTGQLNPLHPKTYQVLKNVIRDAAALFSPEPFFHGGSDEVIPGCWKADPTIQTFLSRGGTLSQLLEIHINSTLPFISSLNLTAVYWEDVLLDRAVSVPAAALPTDRVILQTWNGGPENTKRIVKSGYRVIVSSSDFYYLDCGHGQFVGNDSQYDDPSRIDDGDGGSWCGPFKTWATVYNYDIAEGLSEEEKGLVMGGEVALWSEQADPTVVDARIWPRAAAAAEALWSGNRDEATGVKRYAEATDRLNEWRERMVRRGIRAEPIQPLWCVKNPGMCNTVHSSVVFDK